MIKPLVIGLVIFVGLIIFFQGEAVGLRLLSCLVVGFAFVAASFRFSRTSSEKRWSESDQEFERKQTFANNLFWIGIPNMILPILYYAFL